MTVAFLYNAAVAPLRTAFSPAPIYNVTGVYPASSATHDTVDAANDCTNNTTTSYYTTSNITDAGKCFVGELLGTLVNSNLLALTVIETMFSLM